MSDIAESKSDFKNSMIGFPAWSELLVAASRLSIITQGHSNHYRKKKHPDRPLLYKLKVPSSSSLVLEYIYYTFPKEKFTTYLQVSLKTYKIDL